MSETQVYEAGQPNNVRLIALNNGTLIVAEIIEINERFAIAVFPMEMLCDVDDNENLMAYKLVPYLDRFVKFDIDNADPFYFNVNSIFTCTVPNWHIIRNY